MRLPLVLTIVGVLCGVGVGVGVSAYTPLAVAGNFTNLYDPSANGVSWYVNDHTLVFGAGEVWHLWGITHTNPADPLKEDNFAHATGANLTLAPFIQQPFALGSILPETQLWAPYVFLWDGVYYMYYCGGGDDRTEYYINLATSTDLWSWQRRGTMFRGGIDGRDPVVLSLGPGFGNQFLIVYTGTNPDSVTGTVRHVNYGRTSTDLLHWSDAFILFDGGVDGNNFGGPTESPFVVRRGANFYLFNGAWEGQYALTRIWVSQNPFNFGNATNGSAVQCGEIVSHALEVVRGVDQSGSSDGDGGWYVTHSGWGQGGVWIAPLMWLDGLTDPTDVSLPVPTPSPNPLPVNFDTSFDIDSFVLSGENDYGNGQIPFQFVATPAGYCAGDATDNAYAIATKAADGAAYPPTSNVQFSAQILLITKDGNPTSGVNNNTRAGSAAGLVLYCGDPTDPAGSAGAYFVNLFLSPDGDSGVKMFKLYPEYQLLAVATNPSLVQGVEYTLSVTTSAPSRFAVYLNGAIQFAVTDSSVPPGGFYGVYVWQGSAVFQAVTATATKS